MKKVSIAIISLCLMVNLLAITGCSIFDSGNGNSISSPVTTGDASLNLNFVIPPNGDNPTGNASIRGNANSQVKVLLTIRKPGSATDKPFSIYKVYPITGTELAISISGLPTGLMIAKIQIEQGNISGSTDFHGAGDLAPSIVNNIDVSPAGSKLTADLLASALQEAINNDTIMAAAGSSMATTLRTALGAVDVNAENPYSKALDLLIDQVSPTGMVKVSFDNTAKTLTGMNGSIQAWQKTYSELLGTSTIAGVAATSFTVVRVIRQGFGSYSIIEWRDTATQLSILTTHNNTTGVGINSFLNQGIMDQTVQLSETEMLLSGYNVSQNCPFICKWNVSKDSYTEGLGGTKNLEWEKYFTDIAYTATPATGGKVSNLILDITGKVTAILKLESNALKTYLVSLTDGTATALSTATTTTTNQAPTVSITAPTAGSSSEAGQTIAITANAADADGSISKVEFYNGTTLLGSDDTAPYNYSWASVAAGSYSITAKAYDNLGQTTDSAAVAITVIAAATGTGPELMISEISSSQYSNTPRWFEVINKTTSDLNLSNYSVRMAYVPLAGGNIAGAATFALPSLVINPGKMAVVRVKTSTDLFDGPALVNFTSTNGDTPYWGEWGYIDLIKNSTSATVDYVKYGIVNTYFPAENPTTTAEWSGAPATAMPDAEGYSLVRNLAENDNNTATNWTLRAHNTPGATNDVISDTDADGDGIPDENEAPGKTYCGLPYYDWGARAGTTDVFVHIDYMDPAAALHPNSVTPREAALARIVAAFKARSGKQTIPIEVHFDVGTLFGTTVDKFCLDSGNHKVTYTKLLDLSPSSGVGSAYSYKAQSMPLAKLPVFHYCLIGDQPNGSSGGLGEIDGNDFITTLGAEGQADYSIATTEDINRLNYELASTIMHELGHNLGLRHGGNEDVNYKPNYISIMNYMYSNYGLPVKGNAKEGDRYYYYRYSDVDSKSTSSLFKQYFNITGWWTDMHNNPSSADVVMDFSDGSSAALNESSLSEATGLGRSGSAAVDFNGDGDTSDSLSMNLNSSDGATLTSLTDFNDWGAIGANFSRSISGVASIRASSINNLPPRRDYLSNDFQEIVTCTPVHRCSDCDGHEH